MKLRNIILAGGLVALVGVGYALYNRPIFNKQDSALVVNDSGRKNEEESVKDVQIKRQTDTLVNNNSNLYRHTTKKSEEEGVKDIRKLLETSNLEEAWVYLPKKSLWIEIGKNAFPRRPVDDRIEAGVELDLEYLARLRNENDELVVYHIHLPDSKDLEEFIEEREKEGEPLTTEKTRKIKSQIALQGALPSSGDLANMLANSIQFFKIHPQGSIKYKICSSEGVAEFYITEKEASRYSNTGVLNPFSIQTCILISNAIRDQGSKIVPLEYSTTQDLPPRIIEAYKRMKNIGFMEINFTFYENDQEIRRTHLKNRINTLSPQNTIGMYDIMEKVLGQLDEDDLTLTIESGSIRIRNKNTLDSVIMAGALPDGERAVIMSDIESGYVIKGVLDERGVTYTKKDWGSDDNEVWFMMQKDNLDGKQK